MAYAARRQPGPARTTVMPSTQTTVASRPTYRESALLYSFPADDPQLSSIKVGNILRVQRVIAYKHWKRTPRLCLGRSYINNPFNLCWNLAPLNANLTKQRIKYIYTLSTSPKHKRISAEHFIAFVEPTMLLILAPGYHLEERELSYYFTAATRSTQNVGTKLKVYMLTKRSGISRITKGKKRRSRWFPSFYYSIRSNRNSIGQFARKVRRNLQTSAKKLGTVSL